MHHLIISNNIVRNNLKIVKWDKKKGKMSSWAAVDMKAPKFGEKNEKVHLKLDSALLCLLMEKVRFR